MPELLFRLRWPDGSETVNYSPSTIVRNFLSAGEAYEIGDFIERSRLGLRAASARVEEKYGHPCVRAQATLASIEQRAIPFAARDGVVVTVLEMSP